MSGSIAATVAGQSSGKPSPKNGTAPFSRRSPAHTTSVPGTVITMSWSVCPRPRKDSSISRPPSSKVTRSSNVWSGGSMTTSARSAASVGSSAAIRARRASPVRSMKSTQRRWPQIIAGRNT